MADTPRTKELKELRQKRLAYYQSLEKHESGNKTASPRPPLHPNTLAAQASTTSSNHLSDLARTGTTHNTALVNAASLGLPKTSSPRGKINLYRPRSSSAHSGLESPINGSNSPNKFHIPENGLKASPRRRSGSFSSDGKEGNKGSGLISVESETQRLTASRESFESLFSDIGSEFTDITNTDLLLSERFADESLSNLRERHKKDSSRSRGSRNTSQDRSSRNTSGDRNSSSRDRNSSSNSGTDRSPHIISRRKTRSTTTASTPILPLVSKSREEIEITKLSLDLYNNHANNNNSKNSPIVIGSTYNNSSESDFGASSDVGKSYERKNKRKVVKKSSNQTGNDSDRLHRNDSGSLLDVTSGRSGSHTSGQNMLSDRTSVWIGSDKSTGRRTNSNDNVLKSTGHRTNGNDDDVDYLLKKGNTDNAAGKVQGILNENKKEERMEQGVSNIKQLEALNVRKVSNKQSFTALPNSLNSYQATIPAVNHAQSYEFTVSKQIDQKPPSVPYNSIGGAKETSSSQKVGNSTSKSKFSNEEFNYSNLSAVLGEEKLKRLLHNFQESEDYGSDIQSEVASLAMAASVNKSNQGKDDVNIWASLETDDGSIIPHDVLAQLRSSFEKPENSVENLAGAKINTNVDNLMTTNKGNKPIAHVYPERYHRENNELKQSSNGEFNNRSKNTNYDSVNTNASYQSEARFPQLSLSIQNLENESGSLVDELGLETHRPSESPREIVLPYHHSKQPKLNQSIISYSKQNSLSDKDPISPGTLKESGTVKYCFSVDEIYAKAGSVPFSPSQSSSGGVNNNVSQVFKAEQSANSPRIVSRKDVQLQTNTQLSSSNNRSQVRISTLTSTSDQEQQTKHSYVGKSTAENVSSSLLNRNSYGGKSKPPSGIGNVRESHLSLVEREGKVYYDKERKSDNRRQMAWSVDTTSESVDKKQGTSESYYQDHLEPQDRGNDRRNMAEIPEPEQVENDTGPTYNQTHHSNQNRQHSGSSNSRTIPSSIERYFQSIEQVSHVSSVCSDTFEPVPEPDIEITPRGPLQIQGKQVVDLTTTVKIVEAKTSQAITPPNVHPSDGTPMHHKNKNTHPSPEDTTAGGAGLEKVSDDELFHLVQSAITEIDTARSGAITQKLQELGINFDFLKESYECHKSGQEFNFDDDKEQLGIGEGDNISVDQQRASGSSAMCPNCNGKIERNTVKCLNCNVNLVRKSSKSTPIIPVAAQSSQSPRVSVANTPQNSHLQGTSKKPPSKNRVSKDSNKSSVSISNGGGDNLQSQLSLNLRMSMNSVDSSATTLTYKDTMSQGSKARSKRRNMLKEKSWRDVDSSISLDYSEKFDNPRESIPNLLKAELSLDVRGSSDSSQTGASVKGRSKGKKLRQSLVQDIKVRDDSETNSLQNAQSGEGRNDISGGDGFMNLIENENIGDEMRIDVEDLQDEEFDRNVAGVGGEDGQSEITEDTVPVIDASYQDFLNRLINDPRLRNRKSTNGVLQPTTSQGRPSTAGSKRNPYAGVQSRVKSSWDKEQPQRRWEKSNLAWSSYNSGELSKPGGTGLTAQSLQITSNSEQQNISQQRPSSASRNTGERPNSAGQNSESSASPSQQGSSSSSRNPPRKVARPSSAGKARVVASTSFSPRHEVVQPKRPRPQSADFAGRRSLPHHDCGTHPAEVALHEPPISTRNTPFLNVQSAVSANKEKSSLRESKNSRLTNYKKYLALAQGYTGKLYDVEERSEASHAQYNPNYSVLTAMRMISVHHNYHVNPSKRELCSIVWPGPSDLENTVSPRVHSGEVSFMQCLPDEIMLMVLSYLSHKDLAKCLLVCQHFNRVASDDSLWRNISIKKSLNMTDQCLLSIAKKQPKSLSLLQCHGGKVTAQGLREVFRACADTLQELNFTGCSRGQLTGDNILLHAAARCVNITTLDASWCNVNDNGIMAITEASNKLCSLCVNGCQQLSDEAVIAVVNKHGIYLHTLELFGCFNITARAIASIANHCKSLTTLNVGQCWKLTDSSISNLAPSLTLVHNLDLRGCKQIKDQTVHQVVKHCPQLRTLSLANCLNLTDITMSEVATYCPEIESLDVCGCKNISNQGIRAFAHTCHKIEYLDLSSTAITSKSVTTLSSYNSQHLVVLKINFCKQINMQCLVKLARNCRNLEKLFLYGVRGLGPLEEVKQENSRLHIESDMSRPV